MTPKYTVPTDPRTPTHYVRVLRKDDDSIAEEWPCHSRDHAERTLEARIREYTREGRQGNYIFTIK